MDSMAKIFYATLYIMLVIAALSIGFNAAFDLGYCK